MTMMMIRDIVDVLYKCMILTDFVCFYHSDCSSVNVTSSCVSQPAGS